MWGLYAFFGSARDPFQRLLHGSVKTVEGDAVDILGDENLRGPADVGAGKGFGNLEAVP